MVGTGPERERLMQRVRDENIRNITMLTAIPKSAIPTFLDKIDIAFIGLQQQRLFRFGIAPNKLMDYMMAKKPIVMAIEAGNDPVTEAGCGRTVPPEDPAAIRHAVLDLARLSPKQRASLGERGRAFVLENHLYPVLAKRFIEAISGA